MLLLGTLWVLHYCKLTAEEEEKEEGGREDRLLKEKKQWKHTNDRIHLFIMRMLSVTQSFIP